MSDNQNEAAEVKPTVATIEPDSTIQLQGQTPAPTPEPEPVPEPEPAPQPKTWYLWKTVGQLSVYDKTVAQDADAEQPANSTEWAPPMVIGDGLAVYWDGNGWRGGTDLINATIDKMKTVALLRANINFMMDVDNLSSGYTPAEQQSWKQQVVDAHAVLAGQVESHLLQTLAATRDMDVKDLANSIIAKSNAYNDKYATLLATYQKLRDTISTATEASQLPAFTIDDVHLA